MPRSLVVAFAVGVIGIFGFNTLLHRAEKDAVLLVTPAAASLGFDLKKFSASISGSALMGTKSYSWEVPAENEIMNKLTYLVTDNLLCWSSVRISVSQDHGCIVVQRKNGS